MDQNNQSETATHAEAEEHIHLPSPSWAPIVLALGFTGVAFGVVLGLAVLIPGAVVMVAGLALWIVEEIKAASNAPTSEQS
jgi:cytochrome c oxidase subunit 1